MCHPNQVFEIVFIENYMLIKFFSLNAGVSEEILWVFREFVDIFGVIMFITYYG
tara:strand:- start:1243 stop:1404 length:162 start_codon:yes stop_codon:yes gene_type:complete